MRKVFLAVLACVALDAWPQSSPPAVTLITGYYRNILGRDPDPSGLAFWQAQAAQVQALGANVNETWRALGMQFFNSAEYRALFTTDEQFIDAAYVAFLGRAPDLDGRGFWLAQLRAGLPRNAVVVTFLFSAEFGAYTRSLFGDAATRAEIDLLVDFYRGFLDRLPDESGFLFWRERFQAAQCQGEAAVLQQVDAISSQFSTGPEYFARRRSNAEFGSDLYNAFMRRGGDLQGILFWQERLDNGARTRDYVRRQFMGSVEFQARVQAVLAQGCITDVGTNLTVAAATLGPTPFNAKVEVRGNDLQRVVGAGFTIAPKPGYASRPLDVTYEGPYLTANGYGNGATGYTLPVFGLYAGYANAVTLSVRFDDGSVKRLDTTITTPSWTDPVAIYARPQFVRARAPGSALGFDYFMMKSNYAPVVVDTDGEVRWWSPTTLRSFSSIFVGDGILIGDNAARLTRLRFDGSAVESAVQGDYLRFHHNIDPGKRGILIEMDGLIGGVIDWENVIADVDPVDGTVYKQWRLADIIADHMVANGDDPSAFVRLGADWFHMNAATYDARDDSLIVSSRESFLIKIDYATGAIRWILGDPTKYWYTFPSLRAKSLALEAGGLYPIGQHAVSVTADGMVMLFNNGFASIQQPASAPVGASRTYSTMSAYAIDAAAMTAREVRRFDNGQSVYSPICSSVYELDGSLLMNYAVAESGSRTRLVGLDSALNVVFDFKFATSGGGCQTGFNAVPLPLHALTIR